MRAEEQFDSFYLKTRRSLVHQTFALTGDLAAAERAVRDAYVAAWHHWRKVKEHEDPRDWVRPRAWAAAQRLHTARLWQRTRDLAPADRARLDALHALSGGERRALIILQLAGVPADVAAKELGVTLPTLERQLQSATAGFAAALGSDSATVRSDLLALGEAASRATLPRAHAVRRLGGSRRRSHTVLAVAAATLLSVGSGAFAYQPAGELTTQAPSESVQESREPSPTSTPEPSPLEESPLPSAEEMLTPAQVRHLAPRSSWRITATHDNTAGRGINYPCQQQRFADPAGLAAIVRTLRSEGTLARRVVQTLEVSRTRAEAGDTFDRVRSWFAGCDAGVHLLQTHRLDGASDRGLLLSFVPWAKPATTYTVGLAQIGQVVQISVFTSTSGTRPGLAQVARSVDTTSRMVCERAGGPCGGPTRSSYAPPPATTETPGLLATVDLPPLTGVRRPWVGTKAAPAPSNPAATSCDQARPRRMGATRTRTRTFLVPQAELPAQFGLTETYATFRSPREAAAYLSTIRQRMASCEDRDLATEVVSPEWLREGELDGSTWRLQTDLSEDEEVVYDVGFVRRGNAVAQLLFVPAGSADLEDGAFRSLVVRAGQRLGELG